jgi:hypothetical protein
MVKICENCFGAYIDEGEPETPAHRLGQLFFDTLEDRGARPNICPKCREELGILSLLGFGE